MKRNYLKIISLMLSMLLTLTLLAGCAGPQGPAGADGAPGANGAAGAKGEKGDTGEQGPAGEKGDKGDTGAQGPTGEKGDTGATGAQGPTGEKGDKGDTGAQGPAGEKGDTGATGAQGPAGAKGDKGDTGATGAQGPAGAKGDKGDTGATGATGTPGKDGVSVTDAYVDENLHLWIVLSDGTKIDAGYVGVTSTPSTPSPTTYTVTFVDYNGTTLKTETVESGKSATAPTNPTRAGYRFTGWNKTFTNVTSNLTITAQYIQQFTVTFKGYDGSVLKSQVVDRGSNATPPTAPVRNGYTFTGWSGTYTNVTSNQTVTATYKQIPTVTTYTVTFKDWNGTVLKSENVESGKSATAPTNPTRSGYVFVGWDKSFTNVSGNLIVTATYMKVTEPTIVISNASGSVGDNVTVTFNLVNSPSLYAMGLKLSFDDTALTLVSAESGDAMDSFTYTSPSRLKNGANFMWYANDPAVANGTVLTLVFKINSGANAGNYSITMTCDSQNTYDANDNDVTLEFLNGNIAVEN